MCKNHGPRMDGPRWDLSGMPHDDPARIHRLHRLHLPVCESEGSVRSRAEDTTALRGWAWGPDGNAVPRIVGRGFGANPLRLVRPSEPAEFDGPRPAGSSRVHDFPRPRPGADGSLGTDTPRPGCVQFGSHNPRSGGPSNPVQSNVRGIGRLGRDRLRRVDRNSLPRTGRVVAAGGSGLADREQAIKYLAVLLCQRLQSPDNFSARLPPARDRQSVPPWNACFVESGCQSSCQRPLVHFGQTEIVTGKFLACLRIRGLPEQVNRTGSLFARS